MYRYLIVGVSTVMFALLSIVAGIIVDLEDQSFPVELGVKAAVYLDFSASELVPEEAYQQLGILSDRLGIGLVKLAPDLSGDLSGQVIVMVGSQDHFPEQIRRFGVQPEAQIRDRTALAHTFSSGRYFVTGDTAQLDTFNVWLAEHQIGSKWTENNLFNTLELLVRQVEFGDSLLAAAALMVSLVLYWLSIRSRGRALRVLAGVSTWRIQVEDLTGLLAGLSAAALGCGVISAIYVGLAHGWVFVPVFVRAVITLDLIIILTTILGAIMLSAASWPGVVMLARREPAVRSLRAVSTIWQAIIFALVLAAVPPAYRAYTTARDAATEQAQWNALSDQVVLTFPAVIGESGIQTIMPDVGNIVQMMERHNAAALSYTWSRDHLKLNDIDSGFYDYLSLVNPRWLDLMLKSGQGGDMPSSQPGPGLLPISLDQVPDGVRQYLGDHMPIWTRQSLDPAEGLSKITFYRSENRVKLPVMLLSHELVVSDRVIIGVVPEAYEMFNDSFLISAASSSNLVFTGLGPTQEQVARHGLQQMVRVRYVAEEGILSAQFSAYFAQLRAGSLAALFVALVLATAIGAFIGAVIYARRDFPLHLAGKSWGEILSGRVAREWIAGVALTLAVILTSGPDGTVLVAAVASAALLSAPLAHYLAARWVFINVSLRRF